MATLALLRLAAITGRNDFKSAAEATLRLFAARMESFPQAVPHMLAALDFWLEEPQRVVVTGDPKLFLFDLENSKAENALALLRAAHSVYQPNKIVLGNTGAVEEFARSLPTNAVATAYLCTGNACQPPTSDAATLTAMLREKTHARPKS